MKNIKTVKLVRLSLIAVFMSIGFTFLSCSPTDELSDDVGIIEEVVEREIYEKPFFMMTGIYFEDGIPNPKYDLVLAHLYVDTDEFIKIEEVLRDHQGLMVQASQESWDLYGVASTSVFVEYNLIFDERIPLMINPNYATPEFQVNTHLSDDILQHVENQIDSTAGVFSGAGLLVEYIYTFREGEIFYQ